MIDPEKSLKHAEHNYQACKHTNHSGFFPDWVITMAYYSANHFVRHALFPITIDGYQFDDLEACYHVHGGEERGGRHEYLIKLVGTHLPEIQNDIRVLHNDCSNARYYDYDVSQKVADRSIEALERIRARCTTPKAAPSPKKTGMGAKTKRKRK